MKILVAENDVLSRCVLEEMLSRGGHTVQLVGDGARAWDALTADDRPALALLDGNLPLLAGVEICRRLRELPLAPSPYLILLPAKDDTNSIIAGLRAGANDFIAKPFVPEELCARINAGVQIAELQQNLANRVRQLEAALSHVRQLQGILPICCYCKKIRDDKNYWQQVETYFSQFSDLLFSHGICPDCLNKALHPEGPERAGSASAAEQPPSLALPANH